MSQGEVFSIWFCANSVPGFQDTLLKIFCSDSLYFMRSSYSSDKNICCPYHCVKHQACVLLSFLVLPLATSSFLCMSAFENLTRIKELPSKEFRFLLCVSAPQSLVLLVEHSVCFPSINLLISPYNLIFRLYILYYIYYYILYHTYILYIIILYHIIYYILL